MVDGRVSERPDVRTARKDERRTPGDSLEDFVVEKLGTQSRQHLSLIGDGDLLDGAAADGLVASGDDFDSAAPEENGVAGVVHDIVRGNHVVEGLADRNERRAVQRHVPRLVDQKSLARPAGERAVLPRTLAVEHDDHGAEPLGREFGVFGFLGKDECGALAFLHRAGVDADGSMEVGVEATVAVAAVAVLHGVARDVDLAGINTGNARLPVVRDHVMHAVKAHAAVRAVVVFKDHFLRAAAEDSPVARNGGELVAGDVTRRAVEHEDLQRGVDVAVGNLDIRSADIDRAGSPFVAPTFDKDIFCIRVVTVGPVVVDEAVEPHEHAADRDMPGVRRIHRKLALDAGMVVDRVNGEVFDGEVPLAPHEVGMRLESSPLDRFDLLGAPVEFFLSLHARQQVVHIRKGGEAGTRTAEGHVHGNVEPLGQNEDTPGKRHHPTPGLACSIESLLHRIGAVHLFLGQHGSGVLQVAGLGGNRAVFRHIKNPVRHRFPRNNADTPCGCARGTINEAIVEIHRVFTRFHVAGQRNADGEFVDGFRSKNGRCICRAERDFGPGKEIQVQTEETEPAAGCGGFRFIALHPPNLRGVEDGWIGGFLAVADAESHNSIADLGWEGEFQG